MRGFRRSRLLVMMALAGCALPTTAIPDPQEAEFRLQITTKLATCGIPQNSVSVRYEDVLQDFEVRVSGVPWFFDASQLICLARLSEAGLTLSFEDEQAEAAVRAALMSRYRETARAWLAARDLLEGLPMFDPSGQNLGSYAKSLEAHCGLRPGSILEVYDQHLLTFRGDLNIATLEPDALQCVTNAVTTSNLSDYDVMFGVVGGT